MDSAFAGKATSGHPRLWIGILLLVLVALAVLRSHAGTRLDSFTIDEPWHIVAGASYVRSGDWRINPEHPPLTKLWVGTFMPGSLLVLRPFEPLVDKVQERDFVEQTMYLDNDAVAVQKRARMAMWLFNGLLLLAIGLVAWGIFGPLAASALVILVALEPTLAAHMPLVMTDLPLALTLTLAALCAGVLADGWRWRWALLTGASVGLALATKHSALPGLIALGLALLAVLAWQARGAGFRTSLGRFGKLLLTGLLAVAVLWAHYGLRFHTSPDGSDPLNREIGAKIGDLYSPAHRAMLGAADDYRLLPRPYVWGLADTVRAGVEGRGQVQYRLWGTVHKGDQPWHTWPSLIVSKVPLATLAMLVLALILVARAPLPRKTRFALAMALTMAAGHFAALVSSQGAYAGIRHALPVVMAGLLLIAVGIAEAWRRRSKLQLGAFAALAAILLAATLPEPRVYEFHNRLAGGTENAWKNFANESMDLGQRFHEVRQYYDEVIAPSGLPFYGARSRQSEGIGMRSRYWVESLEDTNVEGVFEGYFKDRMAAMNPAPEYDWDPDTFYAETEIVHRMGAEIILKGRVVHPRTRASGIAARLYDYVYRDNGDDWAMVAERIEEVLQVNPFMVPLHFELGNARVRLGQREPALAAYRAFIDQQLVPMDPNVVAMVQGQVRLIEQTEGLDGVAPLRAPWME